MFVDPSEKLCDLWDMWKKAVELLYIVYLLACEFPFGDQ